MTLCALTAFTVTSCKDEPKEPTPTPTPDAATITVSPTSLSFDAAGATKDLTVKSNADWTVTVPADASWLTVSAKSGSKDGSVKVTAAANAGAAGAAAAAREAKLTFAVEGKKVDVTVSQAAEAIVFVVSGDTAVVPAAGGQVAVKVEYNEAYTVGTLPEWITAATKATKTDNLAFSVAANEAATERTADITFTSASGKTGKVTVKQAAAEVKVKSLSTAQDLVDFAELCRKAFVEGAIKADTLAVQAYDVDGDGVYTLEADIDMNGIAWVPFNFPFNFDGKNHRIYNLVCENATGNAGFIGTLSPDASCKNLCVGSKDYDFATKKGTYDGVSKITMAYKGELITSYYYSGVIGYSHKNTTLDNIVNFAAISAAEGAQCNVRIGGIAGTLKAGVTVTNCTNFGTVTMNNNSAATATLGGISGFMDGDGCLIKGCENYGAVTCCAPGTTGATYIGGITAAPKAYSGSIEDCNNYGEVNEAVCPGAQSYVGGITAYSKTADAGKAFTVKNCNNYGMVHYSASTATVITILGGIMASIEQIEGGITNCVNEGEVVFEAGAAATVDIMVGGIVGRNVTKPVLVDGCVNKGKVSVMSDGVNVFLAGICSRYHQAGPLTGCTNEGEILFKGNATGVLYEGGVVGYNQSTKLAISNCTNKGAVNSTGTCPTQYLGSVQGWNQGNQAVVLQSGCQALGSVSCAQNGPKCFVGGLLGAFGKSTAVCQVIEKSSVNCTLESAVAATSTNSANVSENAGLVVGGFEGQAAGKTVTFGTAEEPIKVMGKVNNVTVTDGELSVATSYKNYLTGNGSVNSVAGGSADHVINAVFADAKPVNDIPDVDFNNPGVTL